VFRASAAVLAFFVLPSPGHAKAAEGDLVVTLPYVADLVRELSCEGGELPLDVLVKPERDPHTFTLLPEARGRIARAKLVVFVSRGFETWLQRPGASAASAPAQASPYFELAEGLPLRRLVASDSHSHGHKHNGGHGDVDPHIWHSPALTVQAAGRLAVRLATYAPARASSFQSCLASFSTKVAAAEKELKAKVATLPAGQRVLATDHDAFGSFGAAFGLDVLSVQGLSTEASPTPARLRRIVEAVRKRRVKAVFLEASVPPRLMQSVSRETGVRIGGTLYADGLGGAGSDAETTISLWHKNMDTIISALK